MLKKIILFVFLLSFTGNAFAHPLDISNSTIGIKENKVNITTYFHSFEIDYLLKQNNIEVSSIEEYYDNKDIIINYVKNNISLKNNGTYCKVNNFEFFKEEIYNILIDGFKVSYTLECTENINNFILEVLFFNNFPFQTNKLKVYNLNNKVESILYKVLTPKISYIQIENLKDFKPKAKLDTDCDGIGDEDEKIYKTDINKVDTDGDRYTDYEEIVGGRNPISPEYGPGQDYRERVPSVICRKQQIEINKTEKGNFSTDNSNKLNGNSYGGEHLKKTLKYISDYIDNNQGNIFYIFLIVYILGIIHAIGPGHSKSLLIAYTIEKNNGYKKGLIYAFLFTATHILDILILFGITTLAFQYIDIAKYSYYIQFGSIIILFIFSIYLIYNAFFKVKICSVNQNKKILLVAFLSGLAPCSFAWSIYFLLLSLGKLSLILPLILFLGLGILTTLVGIVIITVFIKKRSIEKTKVFSKYSLRISASIIFLISIFLLINILKV